jgi:sialic acid synthase SpsE
LVYIIAEIGSNWKKFESENKNNTAIANQIHHAKLAGADAVKFQMFSSKELYGQHGYAADDWALPREKIATIFEICKSTKIDFMCTAFSKEGYDFIDPFVNTHKIASSEAANLELVEHVSKMDKPTIISTGGLNENRMCEVIQVFKKQKKEDLLIMLDCVAKYPASADDYLIWPITGFKRRGVKAGISDHTLGYVAALAAQGCGAEYFEKHFDGLKGQGMKSPDDCVSVDPKEFKMYCQVLRGKLKERRKGLVVAEEDFRKKHQRKGKYRPLPEDKPIFTDKQIDQMIADIPF